MISINETACFSGYRPEKFSFPLEANSEKYINLQAKITRAIGEAAQAGYIRFLSGMARGFDLVCAAILLEMKEVSSAYADIELVAVPPFLGHGFKGRWGIVHDLILEQASEVVTLASYRGHQTYLDRNCYMVDQSSRLICFYDGKRGGTAHTVMYAEESGLEIVNLA